jgi:hypothetical protein
MLLLRDMVGEALRTADMLTSAVLSPTHNDVEDMTLELAKKSFELIPNSQLLDMKNGNNVIDVTNEITKKRKNRKNKFNNRRERILDPLLRLMHNLVIRYKR